MPTADPVLAEVIANVPEPVIVSTNNVFHDLMSCLIEQQIHYRSTKKTFARLLEQASVAELTPDTFAALDERALQHTKLSGGKYKTIVRVLEAWEKRTWATDYDDWNSLTDNEVRSILGNIKGIGTWTIDMILLYTLQRPTIFPADDFHLKQIMTTLYGLDPNHRLRAQMLAIADQWGDQQSRAVLYLLAWKDQQKKR